MSIDAAQVKDVTQKLNEFKLRRRRLESQINDPIDIIGNHNVGVKVAALILDIQNVATSSEVTIETAASMLRDTLDRDLEFSLAILTEENPQ